MEEGLELYYKYYSKEDEEKYKIVDIRVITPFHLITK